MKKKLRLLKDWTANGETYKADLVLSVDDATYAFLVDGDGGMAERYSEVSVEEKSHYDAEETLIKSAVSEALEKERESVKKDAPVITGIKNRLEDDPKLGFKSSGHFLRDVIKAGMPNGKTSSELMAITSKAITGMSEDQGANGGFLIPDEFSSTLMQRTYETGSIASRVTPFTVSGNTLKIPAVDETSRATGSRQGGIRGYWTEEGGQKTISKANVRRIGLELHKLTILAPVTDELLEDSATALETWLNVGFSNELSFMLEDSFISGTGAGMPVGILNSNATVSVGAENGQGAKTILFENILKMHARLYAKSMPLAAWFVNQDVQPQLNSMSLAVGTGGIPVYMPANGLSDAPFGTLMGRPVIPVEYCPTLGTVGDIILADFSQYVTIQKASGVKTASSIHLRFDFNETVFRAETRIDGQSWWNAPLTPFKGTNTQSPFITLATRA